jgi:outer membrane protein OmpA-like peptidoglycan-associated protein
MEAHAAYATAANDRGLSALAPRALAEARDALGEADRAWRAQRDAEEVDHYAYVVLQRIRLAEEEAVLRSTEQAIRKARVRRYQTLLALRAAKAKAAAARALARGSAEEPPAAAPSEATPEPTETAPSSGAGLGAVLTRRGLVLTLPNDAFADDNRATLKPLTTPTIMALVDFLDEYPDRRVRVEAFADASGSRAEALAFSERRAEAVREMLIGQGIEPSRVAAVGYGAAYPVASNEDPEGRYQNRRVEIIISDPRGVIPERD